MTQGVPLDDVGARELHERCQGNPFLVQLDTSYRRIHAAGASTSMLESLDARMINEDVLTPDARRMLAYASLLALTRREMPRSQLDLLPIGHLDLEINLAVSLSLATCIERNGRSVVKLHDIARDAVLRNLTDEVAETALDLFERGRQRGRLDEAAVYAMFTNPRKIESGRFDEVLTAVVRAAVAAKDYALLGTLNLWAGKNTAVLNFLAADRNRYDLWCFGRASELAGLGDYSGAEDALLQSSISDRPAGSANLSDLQAEIKFLQADIAHLQNRYDDAAELFIDLGFWASSRGRAKLTARCTWGHAHVLRHQGRDLERALTLFGEAARMADACGDLFTRTSAVTGATGIKVFIRDVPDDEEQRLKELEADLAATASSERMSRSSWNFVTAVLE
jgi:hypothetical protein